jgi:serine protease Do
MIGSPSPAGRGGLEAFDSPNSEEKVMRYAMGLALTVIGIAGLAAVRAQPPKIEEAKYRDVLEQFQKQFKIAAETAEPSIATIVVSRSEHYPKNANPGDIPGKLGEFDLKEFLKTNATPERKKLGDNLDLSRVDMIPNHGYLGGVLIDSAGLVLTPYHAIEGATKIYVFLPGPGGKPHGSYADIHAADSRSDLAVLRLIHNPENLKPIKFADVRTCDQGDKKATLFKGQMVGLMFNPYSTAFTFDARASIYFGGITQLKHRFKQPVTSGFNNPLIQKGPTESFYKFGLLLEHDIERRASGRGLASANGGTTGGILIDLKGEMVGITNATAVAYEGEIGPGYAIPTDESSKNVIDVLRKGEEVEYGFMAILLGKDLNMVSIGNVIPHGPAENAGLKAGDVIKKINDIPTESYADLLLYTGSSLAGKEIKLTIERLERTNQKLDTVTQTILLKLGKYHHSLPFIASVRPEPVFGLRVDYLTYPEPLPGIYNRSPMPVAGVHIRELIDNSAAAVKFKAIGENTTNWIISHVNGTPISSPSEFYKAAKGLPSVKLTLRDWEAPNRQELTLP